MPPTSKEIVIPIEESDSQIHQQAEENLEQENTENPEETSDRELEIEEPEQDDNCQENDGDQILCHGISEEKLHQGFSGKTKALNNEDLEEQDFERRHACPVTPMPRPMVLPGGRIWRKPKDAYNEEFIAETLISQAEVLVGSTLGVNFRKYETPKIDYSNSAVYKLVHDLDSKKVGLGDRDIIPALQDYYQSPISARHFYCASLAEKARLANTERDKNVL